MTTGGVLPTRELAAKLGSNPNSETRAEVASSIGAALDIAGLTTAEKQVAQEIVRSLAADVERQVRETLSKAVAANPDLPPDVAKTLASDIASVANPVLTNATVLSDVDLIEVIRGGDEAKRSRLSPSHVSSGVMMLCGRGDGGRGRRCRFKPRADLAEPALGRALDRFETARSSGSDDQSGDPSVSC